MSSPTIYHLFFALTLLICTTLFLRLLIILPSINPRPPPSTPPSQTHLMIILGSGGHTAEMLSMLRSLPLNKYRYRTYIISTGDEFSALRAVEFERGRARDFTRDNFDEGSRKGIGDREGQKGGGIGSYCIRVVPRARRIHQSLWSTLFTSLYTFLISLQILTTYPPTSSITSHSNPSSPTPQKSLTSQLPTPFTPLTLHHTHPSLILTNGPGTSLILLLASLFLKFINHDSCWTRGCMRTVYVESWARCRTLSLTGRLLGVLGVVDRFLVQWEGLVDKERRREFRGVLVS